MKAILFILLSALPALSQAGAPARADFAAELGAIPGAAAKAVSSEADKPILPARALYAPVSGRVTLLGNAVVPGESGPVTVEITGWGTFKNTAGDIVSGRTRVTARLSLMILPGIPVSERVKVSAYAEFFRNGELVGGAVVSSRLLVTGHLSNGLLLLNSSGWLTGSLELKE